MAPAAALLPGNLDVVLSKAMSPGVMWPARATWEVRTMMRHEPAGGQIPDVIPANPLDAVGVRVQGKRSVACNRTLPLDSDPNRTKPTLTATPREI